MIWSAALAQVPPDMDESERNCWHARKKHRHDLGHEDHGPKLAEGTTRGIQILLGLWIALTLVPRRLRARRRIASEGRHVCSRRLQREVSHDWSLAKQGGIGHGAPRLRGWGSARWTMIADEIIDEIRSRADIVAVIGQHVQLARRAATGRACARSTARRRRRSTCRPTRASSTASAARRTATSSRS